MQTRCVVYPENERMVVIHASQLHLCDGDHCAAALLSFFGHGHSYKLENRKQAEHANRVARMHGDEESQDTSLFQYQTEEGLEGGLLGLYGRSMIRKAIKRLVQKGYLSIHQNPNKRYGFDKTHYFLFHPEKVIQDLGSIPHDVKITDREGKNESSCVKNNAPIAYLTPDPTNREEENSLTTFESFADASSEALSSANSMSPTDEPLVQPAKKAKKASRRREPLTELGWIWQLLNRYRDDFDVEALNDKEWWVAVGESYGATFSKAWVEPAFADLKRWLIENPMRRPRNEKGWKYRMNISLGRFYRIYGQRVGQASAATGVTLRSPTDADILSPD